MTTPPTPMRPAANLLVFGWGPHATKVYAPALAASPRANLVAVVELAAKHEQVAAALPAGVELVVTEPFTDETVPADLVQRLDEVVNRLDVQAVIVATEPVSHLPYLRWALGARLHVLVDKPIVAFRNVSNDPAVARRVLTEYERLTALAARTPDRLVPVAVQRRYQPGFELVRELVADAAERFGVPVTSIGSMHADGQFRFPHEIETEAYHGYLEGYGKLFHSGMHIVDLQSQLIDVAAERAGMSYDAFEAYTRSVRPAGFLRQVPHATYERRFGREAWNARSPYTSEQLRKRFAGFGELDLTATHTFSTGGDETLLGQIRLLHNSFSRRSWLEPNADLYKKNGRVKHEHHEVQQGPFQSLQIHSYQAKDRHEINDEREFAVGGNNHFAIHVFRNAEWWGPSVPAFEVIDAATLSTGSGLSADRLLTNHAKTAMVDEFLECVTGARPLGDHRSRLDGHALSSLMMATIAESLARGGTPAARRLGAVDDGRAAA